ncbi:MAG: tRNA (adenosine(37)-N6)-threonylcarbamoyltransferase complex transferase subunit TsaD [Chloroflexi bacterium RBG_13_54_9]|nr:MAG: tRNA (adenosine(37)-N6)-threonylcarbamoyltransferase complex transferase subunit TsaD [Chloroflexi bacterium RBG_13_54_9]
MRILGIESSCDETAAAVVEDGTRILSNIIASQVEIHARYGGVVPEVASRQHLGNVLPVINEAMVEAKVEWEELEAIAVTIGPGLAGSLLVGVNIAKAIAFAKGLPIIGVNHLEGHIYANWLVGNEESNEGNERVPQQPVFPLVCLIVSGGHTDLVLMKGHGKYILLGRTRDDAAGEAFDKVARILGLGYPGGPAIQRVADEGNANAYYLSRPWLRGTDDFSFSGLKTAMLRLAQEQGIMSGAIQRPQMVADLAASFQEAVVDVLVTKTVEAARRCQVKQILLAGGVAANELLRQRISERSFLPIILPKAILCTDNAAMIAACGYFHYRGGDISDLNLDINPGLKLM